MLACTFQHKSTENKCEKNTSARASSDRRLKQLDAKHIQDVPDVAEDCCKDSCAPSSSTTLSGLKAELLQNSPAANSFSPTLKRKET